MSVSGIEFQWKGMQILIWTFAVLILACSRELPVNPADPQSVASAFFEAAAKRDVDKMLEFWHPDQRKSLEKELQSLKKSGNFAEMFPKNPQVNVQVKSDQTAIAYLQSSEMDIDMQYFRGRWWMSK